MRRRRLLATTAAAVGLAGCPGRGADGRGTAVPAETERGSPEGSERPSGTDVTTAIGGSVHGRPYRVGDDLGLLERSETNWLHAFLDVRKKLDDDVPAREDPDVVALRHAKREQAVKLFVSLQWNFVGIFGEQETTSVPEPGSDRERGLLDYAVELLEAIGEPVDVVGLGNEPIWETPNRQIQRRNSPLIPFTETVKTHVVDNYDGDPRYLLGAFNRLYSDTIWQDHRHFYRWLFEFARTDDDVDGIDLHIHYRSLDQAEDMLQIARHHFPEGLVTVTEFSPIWRYDSAKWEPIRSFEGGEAFADRYGLAEGVTVTEYLEAAKDDRLSRREIGDFYAAMPWYNVHFVDDMYRLLSEYDVSVGTFGFLVERDIRQLDWTEGWAPFPINCLFQPGLVATDDGAHPHYLDDFRNHV